MATIERFARNFMLRDQMLRGQVRRAAATAILSSIVEGFERDGAVELKQFLSAAQGFASERRAQLCLAFNRRYVDEPTFQRLCSLAEEISRMIGGFMHCLQHSSPKGLKYR